MTQGDLNLVLVLAAFRDDMQVVGVFFFSFIPGSGNPEASVTAWHLNCELHNLVKLLFSACVP